MSGAAGTPGWFDGALRQVNFFSGRLLAARDLADEQSAVAARDAALASALGTGVAHGLVVSQTRLANGQPQAAVDVTAGTAIARDGSVLRLAQDLRVHLVADGGGQASGPLGPGEFRLCGPSPNPVATGGATAPSGAQVLLLGPAVDLSAEQAPGVDAAVSGYAAGQLNRCGARWHLHGVGFRLANLPLGVLPAGTTLTGANPLTQSKVRQRLALACLGAMAHTLALADPLGAGRASAWGALDEAGLVGASEVPLALIAWQGGKPAFVDMWAARRRLHAPADGALPLSQTDRRAAEGEAGIAQFAAQLAELLARGDLAPASLRALDAFDALPPAGILPLAAPGRRGVNPDSFFAGLAASPVKSIEAGALEALLRAAAAYPPLAIAAEPRQLIWRLRARENSLLAGAVPCEVFVTGLMPMDFDARANRAHVQLNPAAPA
jgi:hypothetical protein